MEYKDSKCNAYGAYASDAKLYPALPAVPSAPELIRVEGTAQSYRLQKINEIQKEIATERDKRANLSKKYHRAVRVIAGVDNVFVVFFNCVRCYRDRSIEYNHCSANCNSNGRCCLRYRTIVYRWKSNQ